jgi:hypothetical protein
VHGKILCCKHFFFFAIRHKLREGERQKHEVNSERRKIMHKLVYSTGGIRIEHLCTSVAAALPRGELLDAPGKKNVASKALDRIEFAHFVSGN